MRILFQGDSITDGSRNKDPSKSWDLNHQIGHSYVYPIVGQLTFEYPQKFECINRGISGDTVKRLEARWQEDALDLDPDLLSILVGINDNTNGTPHELGITHAEWYESGLRRILDRSFEKNPDLKLIIMEPFTAKFAVHVSETDEQFRERYDRLTTIREAAGRVARDYGAVFVELQSVFNSRITDEVPSTYWMWDGVHLTEAGNWLVAQRWLEAARPLLNI